MNLSKSNNQREKFQVEQSMSDGFNTFMVECVNNLEGATNSGVATKLFFAQQSGLKLRQIKIRLNGTIKMEAGALYYSIGDITSETKIGGVGGFMKKAITGGVTSESTVKPVYRGTGELVLEPSFKHYILMDLKNEEIIVDKGMFFCCSENINIAPVIQGNISSAMLGGEGIFQISLKGTGVVVLESDVPANEIIEYKLYPGQKMKVDGNFAIARSKNVKFSVTKSDKSLLGSAMNGEGLLNTFELIDGQEGSVWIAPTAPIYEKMLTSDLPRSNTGMNHRQ